MKIRFCFGDSVLNLPASSLSMLQEASTAELRVLIAAASSDGGELHSLCEHLSVSEKDACAALRFWEKAGVLTLSSCENADVSVAESTAKAPDGRGAYTGADVERLCAQSDMRELIDVCAAILGKTFTPTEIESILYLHDGLRLDFEYIVRLCKHCYDIGKPALRYIEKVGISLYDSGAVTVGALEAYIEKEERKSDMEYRIRRLFGIGERTLTPKEREYLSVWTIDWALSFEMIELAYNEMMAAIPQPKFAYENGILKKWVDAGCRTPEEAASFAEKHKKTVAKAKEKEKTQEIGFDLDEFFKAATLRGDESTQTRSDKEI